MNPPLPMSFRLPLLLNSIDWRKNCIWCCFVLLCALCVLSVFWKRQKGHKGHKGESRSHARNAGTRVADRTAGYGGRNREMARQDDAKRTDRLAVPPLPWPARAGQLLVRSLPETNVLEKSKPRTNLPVPSSSGTKHVVTIRRQESYGDSCEYWTGGIK